MTDADVALAWRKAYARQAWSDYTIYKLLCERSDDTCQQMHYLQMTLEKTAKAYFWDPSGCNVPDAKINRSHQVVAKFLPSIFRQYWMTTHKKHQIPPGNMKKQIKIFCQEVDFLAPAVLDGSQRPDNCEYPWETYDTNGKVENVYSPLDHEFSPAQMMRNPAIIELLKAVEALLLKIMDE